jgi:hypothetical protein
MNIASHTMYAIIQDIDGELCVGGRNHCLYAQDALDKATAAWLDVAIICIYRVCQSLPSGARRYPVERMDRERAEVGRPHDQPDRVSVEGHAKRLLTAVQRATGVATRTQSTVPGDAEGHRGCSHGRRPGIAEVLDSCACLFHL